MLNPGTRLGPYEIVGTLGAGGMGEVYKARDTRLDRVVAIKVLPAGLADDPQFRERFEREARVISSLDHPHICALHDVGEAAGTHFLVMQHLDGETLADRLRRGALPVPQALRYAIEIADALSAAHRQGVVHRDLKPANVMVTKAGTRLLDFGLAKAAPANVGPLDGSALATDAALTAQGTILGTFQYMAPEQIEGHEADGRTDIFAFGALLHEMVTGTRAFEGRSHPSLISAIMTADPGPLSKVVPAAPPALDHLVQRCLAKDPDARWQSMRDVGAQLQWIAATGPSSPAIATRSARNERVAWIASCGVLAAAMLTFGWIAFSRSDSSAASAVRFHILPPQAGAFTATEAVGAPHLAVSPDGQRVAFVAAVRGDRSVLWIRPLDSLQPQPVAGTEDASFPFWSPDGRRVAFFAQGKLKRVDLSGGTPQTLCDAPQGRGGSWGRDDVILFAPNINDVLHRVPAAGGVPAPIGRLNEQRQETSHRWPQFLPDGRRFLVFVRSADPRNMGVYLGSIDSDERTMLLQTDAGGAWAEPGALLALHGEALVAYTVDLARKTIAGEARTIVERLGHSPDFNYAAFSISRDGALVYGAATMAARTQLTWVDRKGQVLAATGPASEFSNPALSPDRRRAAVARFDPRAGARDIWLFDVGNGAGTRFSFDAADDAEPMWSPDGRLVVFRSNRDGHGNLYRKVATGAGGEERIFQSPTGIFPTDWSRDGKLLAYQSPGAKTGWNLWFLNLDSRTPQPFLQTPFNEMHARWAPGGKWIAYASDESGTREIWVQTYPPTGAKWQISSQGGSEPQWREDGAELYYVSRDRKLMAVPVKTSSSTFLPTILFQCPSPLS